MNLLELLKRRYTTKAYDPTYTLPQETVDTLLESLRLCPSSVNTQPWHFFVAHSLEGKARIAKATEGTFAFNLSKVRDASHVVVLCSRNVLSDAYLERLVDQENADGRFANEQALQTAHQTLSRFIQYHRQNNTLSAWTEKQTYIALGNLLLSAAILGVDATPIEGFDVSLLDQSLELQSQGLTPLVIVALGRHAESDRNASLPKSRLPVKEITTYL